MVQDEKGKGRHPDLRDPGRRDKYQAGPEDGGLCQVGDAGGEAGQRAQSEREVEGTALHNGGHCVCGRVHGMSVWQFVALGPPAPVPCAYAC